MGSDTPLASMCHFVEWFQKFQPPGGKAEKNGLKVRS